MPNDALRRAMAEAHVTEADLAERCGVDVKTVSRWIADDGRLPHPRHRWTASEALGVDEGMLWPDEVRRNIKTGPDREIVATYPYRSACPKSVWRSLITDASKDMIFAGFTNYFCGWRSPTSGASCVARPNGDAASGSWSATPHLARLVGHDSPICVAARTMGCSTGSRSTSPSCGRWAVPSNSTGTRRRRGFGGRGAGIAAEIRDD
jgi:transcriptional regulator with XRE-family HTH domain